MTDGQGTIRNDSARSVSISWPDYLAHLAIHRRELIVDTEAGAITWPDGDRAEIVEKRSGYGRVVVHKQPLVLAMAHRVVWIAAHGLIPTALQVNHRNLRRWDNRLANLAAATKAGDTWDDFIEAYVEDGPDAQDQSHTYNGPSVWPPIGRPNRVRRRTHLGSIAAEDG